MAVALVFAETPAGAATKTWNNFGSNWANAADWTGGAPADDILSDIATFNSTVTVQPVLSANRSVLGLAFTTLATGAVTLSGGGTLTLGASGINNTSTTGLKTIGVNLTLGAAQTFTNNGQMAINGNIDNGGFTLTIGGSGSSATISSDISGSGGITKTGTGTWTLSGNNSYGGATTISAGALNIQSNTALGNTTGATSVASGAALQLQNDITVTGEALTLAGTGVGSTGALRNISGNNTWTGNVTMTAATTLQSDAGLLAISGNLANGGFLLTLGGAGNGAVSGDISGAGGLTKTGAGTWTLSGNNTFNGTTTVSVGVLNIQSGTALGGTTNGTSVTSGAALQLQGGITVTGEALALSGTGVGATGALRNVAGNNTWTGLVTLGATTTLQSDAGVLTLSGGVSGTNRALTVTGAGDTTISGALATGSGALTKAGAGKLILSGTNTYTGTNTVTGGTLQLGSNSALSAAALTINATTAGTTALVDLAGFNATVASLTFGGATATSTSTNNLSTGAGTLTLGGNVVFTATNNPFGSTLSGNLALGAATRTFTIGDSTSAAFDFTLSANVSGTGVGVTKAGLGTMVLSGSNSYTGGTTVSAGVLNLQSNTALGTAGAGTSVTSGAALQTQGGITITGEALTLNGTGAGSANGALRNISGDNTWTGTVTLATASQIQSDANTLTISGNVTSANRALTVDGSGNTTLSGIVGLGNGGITKNGTGTLTLSGANTFTGATAINAGVLSVQSNGSLGGTGNGTTVATNAALQLQGGVTVTGEALTLNGTGVANDGSLRNISGNNTWTGNVAMGSDPGTTIQSDAGLLTISGNFSGNNRTLTVGGAGNTTLSGVYNTSSGGLIKNGTGTLTLTGNTARTQNGDTLVNDGTLALNMTAGTFALGDGTGTLTIGDNLGLANSANVSLLSSDQIADGTTVTLNSDGRFAINAFNETVKSITGSGRIDLGTTGVLTFGGSNVSFLFGGTIVGAGGLIKTGTGTVTLTGNNSQTGTALVSNGILNIQSDTALGTAAAITTVASGASLQLQGGRTVASGLVLNGNGFSSDGALENVSGNSTWTGNIALNSDAKIVNDAGSLTLQGNITDNGGGRQLTMDGVADSFISGSIMGNLALDKEGSNTLTLTGANTFAGATTVRVGVLNIQSNTALGSTAAGTTVSNLAALQLQNNITVTGEALALTGAGQGGTGALRNISGNNTWTGDITLNADSTIASDSGLLTIQGNIVNNGFNRALTVTGSGDTLISGGINTDTGELFKEGTGTLTLTGNSTFSGSTVVDAGVLNIETNAALGSTLAGTTVTSGAALQLQGGITVSGHLTLNGTGIANDGALRNISGNNTWNGPVALSGGNTLIQSDAGLLTVAGDLSGFNQSLTVGGAGDTLLSGGNDTGTGSLTKNGGGTLTLTGSSSRNSSGDTFINDGTLALNMSPGVNALGTGAGATRIGDNVGGAGSATLALLASNQIADNTAVTINSDGQLMLNNFTEVIDTLAGTGLVNLGTSGVLTVGANNGNSLFGGSITGTGELIKSGSGTLTFNSSINFAGTVTIATGTLALNGFNLTAGTLHITGNTILDFGNSAASILTIDNLIIDVGVLLTVNNWVDAVDFFRVQNNPGSTALSQILFTGGSYTINDTRWEPYDHQVTPAPEPAVYGAVLAGCSTLLLAWRRRPRAAA